jgi:predicted HTH transcriptional regulator
MPRPPRVRLEEVDLSEWQRANSSLVSLFTGGEEAEIRSLLARPEGKTLEFKRDLSSLSPILKTLTAFANTAGGTLVVGRANDGRFHGLDRLDIEGSVLEALDETPRFIRRNTRLAARIEGMLREDIPEYPRVALREALVNAVAHTDYTLRGMQIMVAVYSDRLEIQNPGRRRIRDREVSLQMSP